MKLSDTVLRRTAFLPPVTLVIFTLLHWARSISDVLYWRVSAYALIGSGILLVHSYIWMEICKHRAVRSFERFQRAWGNAQVIMIPHLPPGHVPILICTFHPFKGSQQARCAVDESHIVYEDPINLKVVRGMQGHIICIECALKLKVEPEKIDPRLKGIDLPFLDEQLWGGKGNAPKDIQPQFEIAVKLLSRKKVL